MIYIVQRWYTSEFKEYVDTVLVTINKKYAYYIANKLEHLYPKDDIEVAEWMDGEINGSYNYMLKDVIDD